LCFIADDADSVDRPFMLASLRSVTEYRRS